MTQAEGNPKSKVENPKSPGRREWLLRLGETAVLMGFRGAVRSEATAASEPRASVSGEVNPNPTRAGAADPAEGVLPPGLYEPSNDHLSHALSSDIRFHPIPPGSETDFARPRSGPFQPAFLEPHEFDAVRRIVKLIIGESPAPSRAAAAQYGVGAASASGREGKDAAASSGEAAQREQSTEPAGEVAEWIDLRLSQAIGMREASRRLAPDHRALAVAYYGSPSAEESGSADPPKACREGLRWLEEESQQRHRKPFLGIDERQQLQLLWDVSDARPDRSPPSPGTRFFQWIKEEVIRGYYTSQAGLKELDYRGNSFYPEPPGCEDPDRLR